MRFTMTFIVLMFASLFSTAQTTIGQDGWTILNPQNAEKIIYVSSSEGNDLTGEVYLTPFSTIGSDPFLPTDIKAFKTVAAAAKKLNDGEAVWILIKRGDSFHETIVKKQGKSLTQPFVYTAYGSSKKPPFFYTADQPAINMCCKTFQHFAVVGLSFYAENRDPHHSSFRPKIKADGFNLYAGGDYTAQNILIEGCVFNFYSLKSPIKLFFKT